ncbi:MULTISPECIES: Cas10/Cmr2 second palm domain-containing protein [Caproicibacterium]|uniref:Type III-B CRISPR-associated protein Cas10/Cmr2 n=1 Tax=Caproicibacterium argilliputei TaxID=3030016 RepID=A0AA97H0W2_9FIRM|nr:type III-B CRISPR-associated protein Cas10/Cmr2 [Caproicibacterium argilliputei]WOC31813.1 type III-B CRISPR-associated protein Cas10/Cmr2 [Caproicibacterium argilliputei]
MTNQTYIAITIGPIYDTITLTSSPAGLWAASYMFSYISKRLCEIIVANGITEKPENIISPYFDNKKAASDGIGRYHDRIVFIPSDADSALKELDEAFNEICADLSMIFSDNGSQKDWFRDYLQLHAVVFSCDKQPLLECSKYLDPIELEKTFPIGGESPVKELLDSSKNNQNITIKTKIRDKMSDGNWPFPNAAGKNGKGRLPDMEDITGRRSETKSSRKRKKINSYYAIVKTDGDGFGKYIEKLESGEERKFSEKCFAYCSDSANLIKDYGGIPIYAGGDDLLFIAPLKDKENGERTIIDLMDDLKNKFECHFGKGEDKPTLSAGVVIRYFKYPLYEAFDEANYQLFQLSKKVYEKDGKGGKNSVSVSLQKHSGKSVEFILDKFNKSNVTEKLIELMKLHENGEVLQSIKDKIWKYKMLFIHAQATDADALKSVFANTFDDDIHNHYEDILNRVRELYEALEPTELLVDHRLNEHKEKSKEEIRRQLRLEMLDQMLRFAKFWGEDGEENDD